MQELKDKYIDPFIDFGFKKLFGENCNKELLLDFSKATNLTKEVAATIYEHTNA